MKTFTYPLLLIFALTVSGAQPAEKPSETDNRLNTPTETKRSQRIHRLDSSKHILQKSQSYKTNPHASAQVEEASLPNPGSVADEAYQAVSTRKELASDQLGSVNSSLNRDKAYQELSELYAKSGDFQHAYLYEKMRFTAHDSLLRLKHGRELAEIRRQLAREKQQAVYQLNTYHQTTREADAQRHIFFISGLLMAFGLVSLMAFLLYQNNRKTRQINELLQQQNEEIQQQKEEMEAQRDQIEEESKKLEVLNTTKDKFFSIVAHDLRGPINSLSSFSNLLANELHRMTPQEIKIIAQELNKSVKNTSRLTENLLTWARLQMNNMGYYPVNVTLHKLLEENVSLFQSTAQQKNIRLYTEADPALRVFADESHLRFILRNLIANAVKFTHPNGMIHISAQLEREKVRIAVRDDGVGISPEVQEKIFRIDAKHTTIGTAGEKGTGLGLVLCKEFVEKNGGLLRVESSPGKGSTFAFYLQPVKETTSEYSYQ